MFTLALGATCLAVGLRFVGNDDEPTATMQVRKPPSDPIEAIQPIDPIIPHVPVLPVLDPDSIDLEMPDDEEIRGHQAIEDIAEFAFLFDVDGVTYLSLGSSERATRTGRPKFSQNGEVYSVVAAVETAAMPAQFREWAGREVMVDGTCASRVVGFAEVSRVSGEPPGIYDDREEGEPPPRWTLESVRDDNVTLAARLDNNCTGTWARAKSYPAAQFAKAVDEPALESAAWEEMMAHSQKIQDDWKQQGGEGSWDKAVGVTTRTYRHEATGERWVFVQASREGGCGDPWISAMAVYRTDENGKNLRRVADLVAGQTGLAEVVDLDGDGQPELVMGDGSQHELVDLRDEHIDAIEVPFRSYGCGC